MSGEATFYSLKKAVPIIVITWVLALATMLVIAYFTPFIPIKAGQIDDDAVTADKILDDAITADKILNGAIITAKLEDGTVTSAKILDATITAEDIASGSIITIKVADEAITTAKIADGSVTEAKIADGAIVTVKLADETVTSEKIANGEVNTADLADDAIVTVKLADGSVTSAKILDGTIAAADLATGSVTSIKIANGAVTTSKIADYAVTNLKLGANAIPYNFTYATNSETKTTATWENITGMSVEITLERNSTLLIMFSTEAQISSATEEVYWWAWVDTNIARPGVVWLQPSTTGYYSSISYNFYEEGLTAGKHTVYMQWYVTGGATGTVWYRTLTVMAFPA